MRFTPDRCAHCGGPPRTFISQIALTRDGRLSSDEQFFFCSDDHFTDEVNKFVPAGLEFGKRVHDDPLYRSLLKEYEADLKELFPDGHLYSNEEKEAKYGFEDRRLREIEQYKSEWERRQEVAWRDAVREVRITYRAHIVQQQAKEREKAEQVKKEAEEKRLSKLAELAAEHAAFEKLTASRPIPEHSRFEHTHILGPQGSGKTTLLQQLLLEDLATADPPGYIIIDPKGLLTERISKLDIFHPKHGRLRDRLVIVDPAYGPALNMFHQDARPEVLNRVIELFSYIFSTANARITQRQSIPFGFVVRLVFWMRGDMNTLMDVLEDDGKKRTFSTIIKQFCEHDTTGAARRFFENDFYASSFDGTREQIRTRLFHIMAQPELARMFLAPANNLNLLDCMQKRKIVLVNTNDNLIGTDGSQFLGRYIISMAMNAVRSRGFITDKRLWTPVFLMMDEFQEYADEDHTPRLLRYVREYRMGVIMAHQQMHCPEFNDSVRNAVSSSAIKYAASPEALDLGYMARELRRGPDFLRKQEIRDGRAHFACFVRGMNLQHPFEISVPLGNVQQQPQIPHQEYRTYVEALTKTMAAAPPKTHKAPEGALHAVRADKPIVARPKTAPAQGRDSSEPSSSQMRPDTPNDPDTGDHTEASSKWR